jgi:hypothetical protein
MIAAIVIAVVIVLAGGAFVVYKLTNKKDVGEPAYKAAQKAEAAIASGKLSGIAVTARGKQQIAVIKASEVSGFTFAKCTPFPGTPPTRVCTWTRPGGQLSMALVRSGTTWQVDKVAIGPAGLPPTSSTTPPST